VKVLRLHDAGDLRLHDEPAPEPDDGEVVVRVTAVGLCGSDRHWFLEGGIGDAVLDRPLVLGHEFVGTIESGARAGERVALDPAVPCGRCSVCLAGNPHLCPEQLFAGHGSADGALRASLAWPERLAYAVPEGLSDAAASLLEPLGVALHALDLGKPRPGSTAGVFGCGPLGLLLVQALRASGVETILASDPLPHRAAAAESLGATLAPREVDMAFEAAGDDAGLADAMAAVRPGGRVVLVGIPEGDRTSFTASIARRKGLTLLLSRRMKPTDLPRAIRLAAAGEVELGGLVSGRYALFEFREAFDELVERRGLKVVVEPQRTGDGR
jgi:L-iditol 2-dehydrogenase